MKASDKINQDTKWMFVKQGTCSRTLFHLLNLHFEHPLDAEERASDALAGGIMLQGYQCGQLWGAALAAGAEARRRATDVNQAIPMAVTATQAILDSFTARTQTADCRDITGADFNNSWSLAKYMLSGKFIGCFTLADKWAPEAIQSALDGLYSGEIEVPEQCRNCAAEVVEKMGGNEEEQAMVAGFAGGYGLSGNACGALSAALWMKALEWCRENPKKSSYDFPGGKELMSRFEAFTKSEYLCENITNQQFESIEDHSNYLEKGGCKDLIEMLTENEAS